MVNNLKPRLKKLLSTILLILGLWTIASTAVIAFPPDLREQVENLTVQGAIELLAEKIDDLTGRVSKLELETTRDRACDEADNLRQMPARTDLEVTAVYWGDRTVKEALDYLDRAAEGKEIDPCWSYTDPSKPTGRCDLPTQAEIDQTINLLRDRYQRYLTAKEECERLANEYQEKYGKQD